MKMRVHIYCVAVNVTDAESDRINSTTVNLLDKETCCDTTFLVVFEMNSDMYDCKNPRISFEYMKVCGTVEPMIKLIIPKMIIL